MEWLAKLAGQVVAVDTAPFIYSIEAHVKYLPVVKGFFTALERGDFQAVTSTLTLLEVLVQPQRKGNSALAQRYRDILLESRGLKVVPLTVRIAEQAALIRASSNLKTPDAIQIATAVNTGATSFLTNDAKIAKLSMIEVLVLDDLISV